jgi:hypothetical protein
MVYSIKWFLTWFSALLLVGTGYLVWLNKAFPSSLPGDAHGFLALLKAVSGNQINASIFFILVVLIMLSSKFIKKALVQTLFLTISSILAMVCFAGVLINHYPAAYNLFSRVLS